MMPFIGEQSLENNMDMITQGIFAAIMILWLLSYFTFRRVFAFAWIFDIVITLGLMYAFRGSYAGLMTGVFAGIIVSFTLKFGRLCFGTERPVFVRAHGDIFPSLVWVRSK